MKYIIKKILQHKEKFVSNKILIRLHPSEKKVNFSWIPKKIKRYELKFSTNSLESDLAGAEVVFGTNSMAFIFVDLMNKKIYKCFIKDKI